MCPAIHINSRSWLRSSSTHEPSDPPLRVVLFVKCINMNAERTDAPPRSRNVCERVSSAVDYRYNVRLRGGGCFVRDERKGDPLRQGGDSLNLARLALPVRISIYERARYPQLANEA